MRPQVNSCFKILKIPLQLFFTLRKMSDFELESFEKEIFNQTGKTFLERKGHTFKANKLLHFRSPVLELSLNKNVLVSLGHPVTINKIFKSKFGFLLQNIKGLVSLNTSRTVTSNFFLRLAFSTAHQSFHRYYVHSSDLIDSFSI